MQSSLPMDDNEQIQINSDQNLNQDEEIKKNIKAELARIESTKIDLVL
jgi:hypothetical protein